MKNAFSMLHPAVGLLYFSAVLVFSMFIMQPVCLLISLISALTNAVYLNGKRTVLFGLRFVFPTALLIIIINPIVNHAGITILGYLPWDNPLTLESMVYGVASAVMFGSVVFWFSSFHTVMTSDKLIFLFGRVIPSLSLLLSMALRFVPRFLQEFREIRRAQKMLGNPAIGLKEKVKSGVRLLSVMLSYAMENAIETADSMKARGFGLKGRTAYAIYRMTKRDAACLIGLGITIVLLVIFRCIGAAKFRYFPSVKGNSSDIFTLLFYLLYAGIMLFPFALNIGEGLRWKLSQSTI